jgi:serine/threonine protein phosphatase PrpC
LPRPYAEQACSAHEPVGQLSVAVPEAPAAASPSGRLDVRSGFASALGGRPLQEDFAAATDPPATAAGFAAAIADGVGGASGGRVAAELTVRGFLDAHLSLNPATGVRETGLAGLAAMNAWVQAIGAQDTTLAGMACTFTALILRGRQAHVFHVGDTRLYRLRGEALSRLTNDHVPPRAARRGGLLRAIGIDPDLRADYATEPAAVFDRYLLCTDGIHGVLPDRAIAALLGRRAAPAETAQALVAAAANPGGDNATALVVDVLDLPAANMADLEGAVAARPMLPPPHAGTTLDGFRLDALLSDGRYSRVFRATDTPGGGAVIIKFPKPVPGLEPVLRLAFLREAWIAARLRSPYVAEVIEIAPGRASCLYTVMPLYQGETLEARIARRPRVTLAAGLDIAAKLTRGVAALHRAGVIHRDIKPDNVILLAEGGLRLIDLGVARLPGLEDFPDEQIPGTPSYMAPELFAGAPGDAQSDIWALGVTLWRLFAGSYPFGEIEPFARPRLGVPPSLLGPRPDLPAWLDHALARAMAPREARYTDAIEFSFALENGALQASPSPPRRVPWAARDPVRFWQTVAAILAALLMAALAAQGR